jgi:hypothetical protein
MWVTDLFLSLPQLPLLLLLIFLFREALKAMFGLEVGIFILIVAVIGGFRWMPVARLVRAQFFSLREKEFVEAARALGASTPRQVVRHILPNSLGPVIVAGTIDVAAAIIAESTLSFLGLGFPPDIPTWGRILYDAATTWTSPSHWALFPGMAIFLTVLTINFIGDGLRDALDPRKSALMALARHPRAQDPLQDRRRLAACGRRRRPRHRRRRDGVRGRRIRLRQERHRQDGDEAHRHAARQDRRRPGAVAGARPGAAAARGDAEDPRQGDRHHLPGADDQPEPGLHRRRPDRRERAPARGPVQGARR